MRDEERNAKNAKNTAAKHTYLKRKEKFQLMIQRHTIPLIHTLEKLLFVIIFQQRVVVVVHIQYIYMYVCIHAYRIV